MEGRIVSNGVARDVLRRIGALRLAQAGAEINSAEYLEIMKNTYLPDFQRYYGTHPDCIHQKDGASSHTAKVVQEYCREKAPRFWGRRVAFRLARPQPVGLLLLGLSTGEGG